MLELYHSVNSVCAQKVRVVLAEKGLEYREHLMTLRGDQFDPAYMKRIVNKLVDENVHNACIILTFGTAFRPWFSGLSAAQIDERLAGSPLKKRTEYKRDVALNGLDSKYAREALEHHEKLLDLIEAAGGGWLAGGAFSLADIAVIPYIVRLDLLRFSRLWEARPGVAAWYERTLARPSVKKEILDRMTSEDRAPFKNLEQQPDPWLKVRDIISWRRSPC